MLCKLLNSFEQKLESENASLQTVTNIVRSWCVVPVILSANVAYISLYVCYRCLINSL